MKLKKYCAEKFIESTGIEIQSQHWGDNRKLSIKVIVLEYFPNTNKKIMNESKYLFGFYISEDNEKDACNSHAHTVHLFNKFIELVFLVY